VRNGATMIPITAHQRAVAEAALAAEETRRRHLVVALTGAHAYGFPSPDSDLDLKGVHVEPTERLLGLSPPAPHAARMQTVDGVELDYASNELRQVLAGLVQGKGSFLERVLGAHVLRAAPELDELRDLGRRTLSRRYHHHYRGFATGQRAELERSPAPTAKKLLYVLRTALTGAHLLATGELVVDLRDNLDAHGFTAARELIEAKRAGERVVLGEGELARWRGEMDRALALLEESAARSPLPEEPRDVGALEAFLLAVRRRS
jgi:uncharacterized protein